MKKNKFKLYFFEILLLIILLIVLLVLNKVTYLILSLILFVYLLIVKKMLKKRKTLSIYKGQVNWLMIGFAVIYLGVFYLIGILVNDFVRQPILFSLVTIGRYILPMILIIVASELIRYYFLSLETKVRIFKKDIDISKIIISG